MIQDLPPPKLLTVNIGRQPDSDIRVFGSDIQVDINGSLIRKEDIRYYWLVQQDFVYKYKFITLRVGYHCY